MPTIDWNAIANIKIRPGHIIGAPITVPLGIGQWALKHPLQFTAAAAQVGNLGNVAKMGELLASKPVEPPTDPNGPGYRLYELKENDTLESIALRELGSADRWIEIYELNRDFFDSLGSEGQVAAGTKIKLPLAGGNAPAVTNTPGTNSPAPAPVNAAEMEAYKAAVLKLVDEKAKTADAQTKAILDQLKVQLTAMTPAEVYALKAELESYGLKIEATPPAGNQPAPAPVPPPNTNQPKPPANGPATTNTPAPAPAPAPTPAPNPVPAGNNVTPAPAPAVPGTYTVQRNDSLWTIAQGQLGDANRWRELVELNKAKYPTLTTNPDFIQVGWTLGLPASRPSAAPTPNAPAPLPNAPTPPTPPAPPALKEPNPAERAEIIKQFGLENSPTNWNAFWAEVSAYPNTSVGPNTGTDQERKALQQLLGKLGFPVEVTGSYVVLGPDGKPKLGPDGQPQSPTADAVIAFKRMAGISQGYKVMGPDGKPTADVNEFADARTREAMQITLRLLQNPGVRQRANMEAAAKEAAALATNAIGAETAQPEARAYVQQYLKGLGYQVQVTGNFDKATEDALIDFKRKNNLAASYKDDQGNAVYTPYVDSATAEALFQALNKQPGANNRA
jgi:nucleoid-associated protein YgaU